MWKRQGPSIKNTPIFLHQMRYWGNRMSHKVTWWILVRHFSTQRIYCQLHQYNIYHKKPHTLNSLPPPPPRISRISTWISIIVALVSKCSCGRLSLRVTDQKQLKTSPELWLADCKRFASDEIYFLSSLVSSVLELDIVRSLRDRVVACSASDRQGSNSCVEFQITVSGG